MVLLYVLITLANPGWTQDFSMLWTQATKSSNCQQNTPLDSEQLRAHFKSLSRSQINKINQQLIAGRDLVPASCLGQGNGECVFGEAKYLRLVYLLDKYGLNASHLQELPKSKRKNRRDLQRDNLLAFEERQLDIMIIAAKDASPHLIKKDLPITVIREGSDKNKMISGSFQNFFDRPVIGVNPDPNRMTALEDKIMFFHELCHAWADRNNHLDVSDEWIALTGSKYGPGPAPKDLKEQFKTENEKALKISERFFVSDYARRGQLVEDFAETCVAQRYGVREWKDSTPELGAKFKFISDKVFNSADFVNSCPKQRSGSTSGGEGGNQGRPANR